MSARKFRALFCALGFALFLYGCGDLGMVLPSQGSYRISARVTTPRDNFDQEARSAVDKGKDEYTLDAYSVVNRNSEIQPYFVNAVTGDQDVLGLAVFVQDYSGKQVGRKVYYMLKKSDDPQDSTTTPAEAQWEVPGPTETPAEANPDGGELFPGDYPEGEAPVPGAGETAQAGFPETGDDGRAGEPESAAELPPEAPGFDAPAVAVAADPPADGFGGTGGGETEIVPVPAIVVPEPVPEIIPEPAPAPAPAETVLSSAGTEGSETETAPVDAAPGGAEGPESASPETVPGETGSPVSSSEAGTGTGDSEAAKDTGTEDPAPGATPPEAPPVVSPPEEPPEPVIPKHEIRWIDQFDQDIPPFRITEELKIGRYNLVFQVMGKETEVGEDKVKEAILYRTFKPIYFLGDAKFTLEDNIQSFLPVAVNGRLIPMGINVMLKTEIKVESRADEPLDPYIIWYNGKKIIAQGRMSMGANYLLWKTPEKTGFQNIRVEVFPLRSDDQVPGNMIGKISRELSLPVSSKSLGIQQFNESSGEFIGWYQFWGTLDDAKAPLDNPRKLASLYGQPPRWIPFKELYSLFVGRNDVYTLPGTPFKLAQGEQGTGRMYLHLAALSEGSILSIRFAAGQENPAQASAGQEGAGERADGTAALDLFLAGDAVILRIASEDESREESLKLDGEKFAGEFITVAVEFGIAPDRFDAELRLENPAEKTTGLFSVALAKPISGEGVILLGGGEKPVGYGKSAQWPVFDETETFGGGTMALNELAFSYVRLPIPESEEDPDPGVSENLLPGEEEPGAEQEPLSLSAL